MAVSYVNMDTIDGVLSWSAVPELMNIYLESPVNYYPVYGIIQNWYNLHTFPENTAFFVTPHGEVDKYGTFAVIIPEYNMCVFESKNPDLNETKVFLMGVFQEYFKTCNYMDLGPVEQSFFPVIEDIGTQYRLCTHDRCDSTTYFMERERIKRIPTRCPHEVYIGMLREEHADIINEVWPHRYDGSVNFIRHFIRRNGGIGVFLKDTNEMVAWAIHTHYNGPGQLQTKITHRRKGYGELALIESSKFVADKGLHVLAYVVDGNVPSHTLFNKLGFSPVRRASWFRVQKY
ncbi:UNVERIFIED_CONTAM: hypothetical protein PYX00_008616 [Menopon gallinae]|uniref:N-acetyltransferase domain-containing protein n=1 Tax=Menopon gallinae TaxID=328185 RepID=A0AAW2HNY1_9NEOP